MTAGSATQSGVGVGIVCPEPPAAQVGLEFLSIGASAIDAAVAAAFVQAVVNPLECGLGGTGLLHFYDGVHHRSVLIDGGATVGSGPIPGHWERELLGRSETVGRYFVAGKENQLGYKAILTPGFVRCCWAAFQRYASGRFSWSDLLAPAIRIAERGFAVYPHAANLWRSPDMYPNRDLYETLGTSADAMRLFTKSGQGYEAGDVILQPELGGTLRRLAGAGGDDFYAGEIAELIAGDLETHGSLVTKDDLRDYTAVESSPVRGRYRGYEIHTSHAPSPGSHLLHMLNVLEHFDATMLGHNTTSYIDTFARVMRATFADAGPAKSMGNSEALKLERRILTEDRARQLAQQIRNGSRMVVRAGTVLRGTTHLTCVDRNRSIVCFTHSIGTLGGSGTVTPELGFLYNDFMGHLNPRSGWPDSIRRGKRNGGGVPTIAFSNGEPHIALGAPGGSRLITSVAQVLVNLIDHQMSTADAVASPRFHSEEEQVILLEPTFPLTTADELRAIGNDVRRTKYMSRVQAIRMNLVDRSLDASPDPRGGTVAIGEALGRGVWT